MSSEFSAPGQPWKRYVFKGTCQHCGKDLTYGKVQKSLTKEKEWVICGPKGGCEEVVMVTADREATEAGEPPAGPRVIITDASE